MDFTKSLSPCVKVFFDQVSKSWAILMAPTFNDYKDDHGDGNDNPCLQVSKSWNVLALDGSNWQKVDLFEFQVGLILLHPFAFECFELQKSTIDI